MKLSTTDQALLAVIELAQAQTRKTGAVEAIKANDQRIETKTATHDCVLYKMANGTPAFKATPLEGGNPIAISGFKLTQKAAGLDGHGGSAHNAAAGVAGKSNARSDSAERNRSVGLMRRKSG